MGSIYKQKTLLRDGDGNPILDADGNPTYKLRSAHWFIQYVDANHRKHRESAKTEKVTDARKLLQLKEGNRERGEVVGTHVNRITTDDGFAGVVADYRMRKRSTADDVQRRIDDHLLPFFGGRRMAGIESDEITRYIVARQVEGAADGTINRELAIVRRAFRLAVKAKKLTARPDFELLPEDNARQEYYTQAEYESVRDALPSHLRPIVVFAFWTGWRKEEILSLEWRYVDFERGTLTLDPKLSKNKEGRTFIFEPIPELKKMLEDQYAEAKRIGKEQDKIGPPVFFQSDGRPITASGFKWFWTKAREAAGVPQKNLHDFRKTTAGNLRAAGVSDNVAAQVMGHKTLSMYFRYSFPRGEELREASEKLAVFAGAKQPAGKESGEKKRGRVHQFKQRAGGRG